jgi:hypothetical protein
MNLTLIKRGPNRKQGKILESARHVAPHAVSHNIGLNCGCGLLRLKFGDCVLNLLKDGWRIEVKA